MKDTEREEKLISLLAARRTDAFWAGQKARVTAAAAERRGLAGAWMLAPAAAMAAVVIFALARAPHQAPPAAPQAVSTAFLENLDLLDDMDVLEAVREEDL